MPEHIENKFDCTGCSACYSICPVNCIKMIPNSLGFKYPIVDENKCLKCGKCVNICPLNVNSLTDIVKNDSNKSTYVATSNNANTLKDSSSGGAFTEICNIYKKLCKSDVLICGATIKRSRVKHCINYASNISDFRHSKYVQSDMDNCFRKLKEYLDNDKYVVFTGTPCQVAGLRMFLGKDYGNLLCIDFVCHGVGSPALFDKFIEEIEHKYNKKVYQYTFRYKDKNRGNNKKYISRIDFNDGSHKIVFYDYYNRIFRNQLCFRDSCGNNCHFRNQNRMGDITIADFNHFYMVFPNIDDDRVYSTVIANTSKGLKVVSELNSNMTVYSCDIETIKFDNPLYYKSAPENKNRLDCINDFNNGFSVKELAEKYTKDDPIITKIKYHVPYKILKIYRKVNKKIGR